MLKDAEFFWIVFEVIEIYFRFNVRISYL